MCALRPDGKWACFECGIVVPRQNGKGAILEARALGGLFLFGERLIMWSAHEYKTAMEGFRRLRELIDNTDDLRRQVRKVINTNGEEGIELLTGQRCRFIARSKGSGRGFSGDCNLYDEWFAGTNTQVSALMPTVSARPNPQLIYTSSPPLDEAAEEDSPGAHLYALRERGMTGDDPGLGWFDWSADLDIDSPEDRAKLGDMTHAYVSNPALGIRITEETVGRELRSMGPVGFMRERLCVWPNRSSGANLIDPKQWATLRDPESQLGPDVAFAIDVTPGRDHSCIAVYGLREDELGHAEIVDHRRGTDWVVARLLELVERWNPVGIAVDARGPAASLLLDLEKAGLELSPRDPEDYKRGQLCVPSSQDVGAATGQIVDAATQGTLRHIDQPSLNVAVAGAKTRPLGDGMAWARRLAVVDISPLCAVTLARWAFVTRIDHVRDEYNPDANIW
jgi:phage terminase large subunit-like protein